MQSDQSDSLPPVCVQCSMPVKDLSALESYRFQIFSCIATLLEPQAHTISTEIDEI